MASIGVCLYSGMDFSMITSVSEGQSLLSSLEAGRLRMRRVGKSGCYVKVGKMAPCSLATTTRLCVGGM